MVELLLSKGAVSTINDKDILDRTPLNRACQNGNTKVVELLINNGAKVNDKNDVGHTPLYIASLCGHLDTVKILIKAGAISSINEKTTSGITPLEVACRTGNKEIVQLLLSKGATIDNQTINAAKAKGYTDIVNILEKWPHSMTILALQEDQAYNLHDMTYLEDLDKYMGTQGDAYGKKSKKYKKSIKSKKYIKSKKSKKSKKSIKRRKRI